MSVHSIIESYCPPALVAVGTSVASMLSGDPIVAYIGATISGGWLVLGFLNYRLKRDQFRESVKNRK